LNKMNKIEINFLKDSEFFKNKYKTRIKKLQIIKYS